MRRVRRIVLVIVVAVLVCVLGLAGVLVYWSTPGQPKPFVDENGTPLPGSVSEKLRITINGAEQGMFIKGRDTSNPVLLYLHGGMPEYFLAQLHETGLEDRFTVCWWEQRGSGLSYAPGIPREGITAAQLIADTLEVTDYLRRRFGQRQIYLMGHSGGTFLGIQAAARAPELYHAYVAVAQVSHQLRSEVIAYEHMLRQFRALNDTSMVRRLEAAPVSLAGGVPAAYLSVRDEAMHTLGIGTTRHMTSVVRGIFLPSLQCRDYTIGEKINLWRGKASSGVSAMWREMLATDLATTVPEVGVPVYFLHGVYDYTCAYAEAKSYFEKLKAPLKGFYTFARSAHSPVFEEPGKALTILLEDVLVGTSRLADKP